MLKIKLTSLLSLILLLGGTELPKVNLEVGIALLIGLSVRFVFNWSNKTITLSNCIQRLVYAIALSYLAVYLWRDFQFEVNIIYSIAGIGAISAEIVNVSLNLLEMGFKSYARKFINNILGKNDNI